eukprot:4791810-Pyramimonas_sp.AAC.1
MARTCLRRPRRGPSLGAPTDCPRWPKYGLHPVGLRIATALSRHRVVSGWALSSIRFVGSFLDGQHLLSWQPPWIVSGFWMGWQACGESHGITKRLLFAVAHNPLMLTLWDMHCSGGGA